MGITGGLYAHRAAAHALNTARSLKQVESDGATVSYVPSGYYLAARQAALLRSDRPVPPDAPLYYFEMHVLSGGDDTSIGESVCDG